MLGGYKRGLLQQKKELSQHGEIVVALMVGLLSHSFHCQPLHHDCFSVEEGLVKVNALLVPPDIVVEMFAGLLDACAAGKVALLSIILEIECSQWFWDHCEKEVSQITALAEGN